MQQTFFNVANKNLYLTYFRVEVPTEKRVKRWAIAMEEIMSDPTGE